MEWGRVVDDIGTLDEGEMHAAAQRLLSAELARVEQEFETKLTAARASCRGGGASSNVKPAEGVQLFWYRRYQLIVGCKIEGLWRCCGSCTPLDNVNDGDQLERYSYDIACQHVVSEQISDERNEGPRRRNAFVPLERAKMWSFGADMDMLTRHVDSCRAGAALVFVQNSEERHGPVYHNYCIAVRWLSRATF